MRCTVCNQSAPAQMWRGGGECAWRIICSYAHPPQRSTRPEQRAWVLRASTVHPSWTNPRNQSSLHKLITNGKITMFLLVKCFLKQVVCSHVNAGAFLFAADKQVADQIRGESYCFVVTYLIVLFAKLRYYVRNSWNSITVHMEIKCRCSTTFFAVLVMPFAQC